MHIQRELRQVHLKILYYGATASGKAMNFLCIRSHIDPLWNDHLIPPGYGAKPISVRDSLQLRGEYTGFTTQWLLYPLPGLILYVYSLASICSDADGVVFVVDSQFGRLETNVECLHKLEWAFSQHGMTLSDFPWIIQYNKRDLPHVAPISYLQSRLNPYQIPYVEASAQTGEGVMDTLRTITLLIAKSYHLTDENTICFTYTDGHGEGGDDMI